MFKGTTTIGVVCKNGIILATDRRVTSGIYVAHKRGRKIYILDDNKAATIAGLVADAQMIMDYLKYQINLMKLTHKLPISTRAVATLASNILFSSRYYPYIVQFIIAGMDGDEPKMYVLDWFGTLTEEKFVATGSGTPYAIGVLEAILKTNPTIEEALPVIAKAVKSAMERDPGSGEGIDILILRKEGIKELSDEEISNLLKS
ncbi:MAG: proteasome subunit beta [Candidatus Methanomethylicota archaeon]|uniref:Proteasome subunit beta n=1 Tax=Thermoproteota archaeon TaxID=2056631 RepID=A0A523BFP5_9CREN|nr:proteasome subunit beta [Candidatus Methanomethylicia archaeon]NHV45908.1 proteasome subunit beta [Candidatus Verstraetearchaeota archaeon]RZN56051.1 MAG: proteasome subunit beta [Candidatus Verstraetearchaeota archaeon]TDA39779.1 MAG: proteasome subunit beta [Candidatus Verstraetearchaeota archaeon]